jgi:hypothetical protein
MLSISHPRFLHNYRQYFFTNGPPCYSYAQQSNFLTAEPLIIRCFCLDNSQKERYQVIPAVTQNILSKQCFQKIISELPAIRCSISQRIHAIKNLQYALRICKCPHIPELSWKILPPQHIVVDPFSAYPVA